MPSTQSTSSASRDAPFNPQRLRIARERRGYTQEQLAERCGVTRRSVHDWEMGRVATPPIDRIASALKFPRAFFGGEVVEEIPLESVSFRALSKMTARKSRQVL